jgi:hypothetical protein
MLILAGCPNLEDLRVEDIDFNYQGDSLTIWDVGEWRRWSAKLGGTRSCPTMPFITP